MSFTRCPNCGYCDRRERRTFPPEHYRNNTTPIEIKIAGRWQWFPSVAAAHRETGIHKAKLFGALRGGPRRRLDVRLAQNLEQRKVGAA